MTKAIVSDWKAVLALDPSHPQALSLVDGQGLIAIERLISPEKSDSPSIAPIEVEDTPSVDWAEGGDWAVETALDIPL